MNVFFAEQESEPTLYAAPRSGGRPFDWNPRHAIGIDAIDAGHRRFFEALSRIAEDSARGDGAAVMRGFNELGRDIEAHFTAVEALLPALDESVRGEHQRDHDRLVDEFSHLIVDWEHGHVSATVICHFLHSWLIHHIDEMDRELADALRKPL